MKAIEERIQSHTGPQLIIGDFNTWKQARLDVVTTIANRHDLLQVKFSTSDSTELKHFMNNPLDHIYYSDDLILETASSNVFEDINSSDHKPLLATFALKNAS